MRRRLAVGIEYDGSAYCGWQVQSTAASVQAALESALDLRRKFLVVGVPKPI